MFSCKFILHHVVNRALSTSHDKKFASVAGWPLPVPPDPLPVPDFASLSKAGSALAGHSVAGLHQQSPAWPERPAG